MASGKLASGARPLLLVALAIGGCSTAQLAAAVSTRRAR